jgi:hypothetical protein
MQRMTTISESGLYKLIMRAQRRNPEVAQFQDWVTREVLPAIRKDGGYILGEEKVRTGEMTEDELLLKAMTILKTKAERLTAERDQLKAENAVMERELNEVTFDEWRALRHLYLPHWKKVQVAQYASAQARREGIELGKQVRTISPYGRDRQVTVNVYPAALLDRVAAEKGVRP